MFEWVKGAGEKSLKDCVGLGGKQGERDLVIWSNLLIFHKGGG